MPETRNVGPDGCRWPRNQCPGAQAREAGARRADVLLVALGSGDLVSQVEHHAVRHNRLVAGRGGFRFDLRELGAQRVDLIAEHSQFVGLVMWRDGVSVLCDVAKARAD